MNRYTVTLTKDERETLVVNLPQKVNTTPKKFSMS